MPSTQQPGDGKAARQNIGGVITLVQEGRFTMLCDDGVYRLFLLAHDCPADQPDLEQAMRENTHIAVACDAAKNLIAARARHIYRDRTGPGA